MVTTLVRVLKYHYSLVGPNTGQGFPQGDGTLSVSLDSQHFFCWRHWSITDVSGAGLVHGTRADEPYGACYEVCWTGNDHILDVGVTDLTEVPVPRARQSRASRDIVD